MRRNALCFFFCTAALVALAACGNDKSSCTMSSTRQPTQRFVLGGTFYLPATENCARADWQVLAAPDGAATEIGSASAAEARFTPTRVGTYRFGYGEARLDLTVVAQDEAPFVNHNYYGSRTLTQSPDAIWVANVASNTVSRLKLANAEPVAAVAVGSWPVAVAYSAAAEQIVVVQRGADSLGLIDPSTNELVDAIWLGDEPSNMVLSQDGKTAYIALASDAQIAVVNVPERRIVARIEAVVDPLGMALSLDGNTLYVASHRSASTDQYPDKASAESQRDIAIIDLQSGLRTGHILDVGTTLHGLYVDEKGLWVMATRNDTRANLAEVSEPNFWHELVLLEPTAGLAMIKRSVDLSRQPSSQGYATTVHAMTLCAGSIWAVAEASDLVLELEPETLAEKARFATAGRPRDLLCVADTLWVHGQQGFVVHRIAAGKVESSKPLVPDPRPEDVAAGQAYFTGAGRDFAQNWTCNSCHNDGLTDALLWNAGPFLDRRIPRTFYWLEGTKPLGWAGYLSNVLNYAYTVNVNIGIRPTTQEATQLGAYLASIMPPPAANSWTERDGRMSTEAMAGKDTFKRLGCAGCHAGDLLTSQEVLPEGITEGVSDIPSLVGVYRNNAWLKRGEARSLRDAVKQTAEATSVPASDNDIDAMTRYLMELTGRSMFLLTTSFSDKGLVGSEQELRLTFSRPLFDEASNLGKVQLLTQEGKAIAMERRVENRHLHLKPQSSLPAGASLRLVVSAGLASFDEVLTAAEREVAVTVASAPSLDLDGDYEWAVEMPAPDFVNNGFDTNKTVLVRVPLRLDKRQDGATAVVDYGQQLEFAGTFLINGAEFLSGPLPIPVGPSFADSSGMKASMEDSDADGIADKASGTLRISGPGFVVDDIKWSLSRKKEIVGCPEGSDGPLSVEVSDKAGAMEMLWAGPDALAVYVTSPGASPPLGPGVVTGGDAYWVLESSDFPNGFASPVVYGEVPPGAEDASEKNGAAAGGTALEKGRCYKVTVTTTDFSVSSTTLIW